jgi:hypothetical protein
MAHLYQDAAPVSGVFVYDSCIPDLTLIRALAMAKEFPHCEVVGVDLAPVPVDLESVPPNCHFEIDGRLLSLIVPARVTLNILQISI